MRSYSGESYDVLYFAGLGVQAWDAEGEGASWGHSRWALSVGTGGLMLGASHWASGVGVLHFHFVLLDSGENHYKISILF